MYWASGAVHGPHHIMKEWADKYKGKFDDGWDKYRERVFERASRGMDSPGRRAHASRCDDAVVGQHSGGGETVSAAVDGSRGGFHRARDVQVGRILDEIDRLGYGENTLIFYIWGDNGSSAEGQNGTIVELLAQNGIPTTMAMHIKALEALGGLDVLGSPKVDNMYQRDGAGPAARRTRGRSWSRRTLGGRAIPWRSGGRRRSSRTRRRGRNSIM